MVDVTTTVLIRRPREMVAAFAADPDNAPRWYKNIESVRWETPKPLSVGSRIAFTARFLGKILDYIYEVIEFESLQKLVMRTASGPFLMETTYEWKTVEEGLTEMKLRNRGYPSGFSKLLTPFLSLSMRLANRKDLRRIKELLEKNG